MNDLFPGSARADAEQDPRVDAEGGVRAVRPPLLLVGHGSRTAAGTRQFLALTERVIARAPRPGVPVIGAFMELAHPDIAEAVQALCADLPNSTDSTGAANDTGSTRSTGDAGCTGHTGHDGHAGGTGVTVRTGRGEGSRAIVAVPLMLAAGTHVKHDIPALLAVEQEHEPVLDWWYARPLGPDPVLLDLLAARIQAVLQDDSPADTHVVLVGRGADDAHANATVAAVARLLWEARGYAGVEIAFEAATRPTVPEALERTARVGARRIVVAPYLLFPGVVESNVSAHVRAFRTARPELDLRLAGVIGDCDELADLVLERYREALLDAPPAIDRARGSSATRAAASPSVRPGGRARTGSVTLVGAGPGASDLITLRGARALASADVVVSDRLVALELLARLRPEVEVVDVGKTPRRPSISQEQINTLLVVTAAVRPPATIVIGAVAGLLPSPPVPPSPRAMPSVADASAVPGPAVPPVSADSAFEDPAG